MSDTDKHIETQVRLAFDRFMDDKKHGGKLKGCVTVCVPIPCRYLAMDDCVEHMCFEHKDEDQVYVVRKIQLITTTPEYYLWELCFGPLRLERLMST